MERTLAEAIASRVLARRDCIADAANYTADSPMRATRLEWVRRHKEEGDALARECLPSGSGFDNGSAIDWERSNADRLVFTTAFHHMDDAGFYDGWTEHSVTVRASLALGLVVTVSGRDRNGVKDYIAESFALALRKTVPAGR